MSVSIFEMSPITDSRLAVNDPVNVTIAMGFGENRTVLDASIDAMWINEVPDLIADQGDLIVVEADLPRIAEEGLTYESYAIIMNVGVYNSSAIAAMIVADGLGDDGAIYANYFSFDNITPFQAVNMTASWRPEETGMRTAIWAVAASLESVIGLISNIDTLIVGVLDDFLMRDVFVITPISSTSVFPKVLPFAPFDILFPADFGIYNFVLSTTESLGNMT
ncbi:unnamed protein product, partial [marine sediment metagenome]